MPHFGRARIRQQARVMRDEGETVVLLISNKAQNTARSTPFSIVQSEAPEATSADKQVAIYAKVAWTPNEQVAYTEGGRVKNLKAQVRASTDPWKALLQQCYGVQFEDGTICKKIAERLSDDRTEYILDVEGFLNVSN